MGLVFGFQAKAYRNTGSYASPVWAEITNIKDCKLSLSTDEDDVTVRGSGGWKQNAATLRDAMVDFGMVWDTDDANFSALKSVYLANSNIDMAFMDRDITTSGAEGLRAVMMVSKFDRDEALAKALTVEVSMKPTYSTNAPTWMEVP